MLTEQLKSLGVVATPPRGQTQALGILESFSVAHMQSAVEAGAQVIQKPREELLTEVL
ncbi:MAG: hypothetical protein AB7S38_13150 [Vulcanimicrobiota bacterium]